MITSALAVTKPDCDLVHLAPLISLLPRLICSRSQSEDCTTHAPHSRFRLYTARMATTTNNDALRSLQKAVQVARVALIQAKLVPAVATAATTEMLAEKGADHASGVLRGSVLKFVDGSGQPSFKVVPLAQDGVTAGAQPKPLSLIPV